MDLAEISRQARRIVDANRAQDVLGQKDEPPLISRKRPKYSRSTKGCLACRRQKVKCDETSPTCLRCIGAQRECQWPAPADSACKRKRSISHQTEEAPGRTTTDWTEPLSESPPAPNDQSIAALSFDLEPVDVNELPLHAEVMFSEMSELSELSQSQASQTASPVNLPPLPFTDLSKSSLHSRRAAKGKYRSPSFAVEPPSTQATARQLVLGSIFSAFAFDENLFEFGPPPRREAVSASVAALSAATGSIDQLSNAFPSPAARSLFSHYCNTTSKLLITMGNIGPNPLLALCTPLRLLDTSSAASAAMRMSMLSISVAHLVHDTNEAFAPDLLGPDWPAQKDLLRAMGDKFKKAAVANVLMAATPAADNLQIDSVLAACTLLCIRDVISADPTWRDNLDFAISLIHKRGGPQAMLQGDGYSFTRRYLLENLATHDVFGSFVTGREPLLLGNCDLWWTESVETSQTRWEWESVERSFGVSRSMMGFLARIAVVDSHKRRLGINIDDPPSDMLKVAEHLVQASHCLLVELDIWGNNLSAMAQHVRVTCGDHIYKNMGVIYILADILGQSVSTQRIVKAVDSVLELLSEASAMRMSVMLIWPLLIAGVFCLPSARPKVRSLFDAFRSDYSEDLVAAKELLEEQWRGIDAGLGKRPWQEVMDQLGRSVLLI